MKKLHTETFFIAYKQT